MISRVSRVLSRERVGIKNTIHKTNFVELFDGFNSVDSHHIDCDSTQGTTNLSIRIDL